MPGICNLLGISQAIKRQFGSRFPGLYSPGEPCLCRCKDCTQNKIKRVGCVNCAKIKGACVAHFKNKAYFWLKSANAVRLSDLFCRYACKNKTFTKNSDNKVKVIIAYDANSLCPSELLNDLSYGKEQYLDPEDDSRINSKMKSYYEKTKRVPTQNALVAVTRHKRFKAFTPMVKFMANIGHFKITRVRSVLI